MKTECVCGSKVEGSAREKACSKCGRVWKFRKLFAFSKSKIGTRIHYY